MTQASTTDVEFRILGEPALVVGGRAVPVPGRQLSLLAYLLLNPNQVVTTDRLIDALWGESPPPTVDAALRVTVSKLRRTLPAIADGLAVETRGRGYLLRVDPDAIDAARFDTLVAQARSAADAETRESLLKRALELWRGRPLTGLEQAPFAQAEIRRLEELRIGAVEELVEAGLALGRDAELVPTLEALIAEHPHRERPYGQLMRALYSTGRQAEALAAYRRLRDRLVADLGIEPSPELKALERSILQQEDARAPARVPRVLPTQAKPQALPRARSRRIAIPLAVALAVGAAIAAGAALLRGDDSSSNRPLGSVPLIDETSGRVTGAMAIVGRERVERGYGDLFAYKGRLLVANYLAGTLTLIDPQTTRAVATFPAKVNEGSKLTTVGRELWMTSPADNAVYAVDVERRRVAGAVELRHVGDLPEGIGSDGRNLWVAVHRGTPSGALVRIDPRARRTTRTVRLGSEYRGGPHWLAVARGAVWVGVPNVESVYRVPLDGGAPRRIPAPGGVCGLVETGGSSVWVTPGIGCGTGAVTRIDPRSGRTVAIPRGRRWNWAFGLAIGLGLVWVSSDKGIYAIDPTTNQVTHRLVLEEGGDLEVAFGSLWIYQGRPGTVLRLEPPTT